MPFYLTYISFFLITFSISCSRSEEVSGVTVASSCDLLPGGTGPWTKGSGSVIQSWLQSLLPTVEKKKRKNFSLKADLNFNETEITQSISTVYSDRVIWEVFGETPFDGWIYKEIYDMGTTITYYIYGDFRTAIRGHFRNQYLSQGVETKIIAYRCNAGILELKFSNRPPSYIRRNPNLYKGSIPIYQFEQNTETTITSSPLLMDPLDRANLRIGTSDIPGVKGDALRARRDIPAFTIVAFYSGTRVSDMTKIFYPNMTIDERENAHKNLLSFDREFDLNVPPPLDNILIYRATLAHKANHSFRPNTIFAHAFTPRFGKTRCLLSIRPISMGEEITVNYGYSLESHNIPRWYKQLFEETYGKIVLRKRKPTKKVIE